MNKEDYLNLSEPTLKWAAESINLDIETIAKRISDNPDRIMNSRLTFNEVEALSKITNQPIGFLMLNEPPDIPIDPYTKDVSNLDKIDIYRILDLYEVSDHALGHAIKKLLCAGNRGHKDKYQDIVEACKSLDRWLEMQIEDKES